MTGRPVKGVVMYGLANGSGATTDDRGEYRMIRGDGGDRVRIFARPPEGAPLLGAAREYDRVPPAGEFTADFSLPRGVIVTGRAVERGTGRPMLATQNHGCHGPGDIMGGRVWYRPLAGNATVAGGEVGAYFQRGVTEPHGLFVGLVGADGAFRGIVPPGPGVLLLEPMPGMPFMWEFTLPWKESDGYHRRYPYAPLTRRRAGRRRPRAPGEAPDTLPGAFGPIKLENVVAYRVINPAADDSTHRVEISIPTAPTRRVRFVDPDGRPVRRALVFGVTAYPHHRVALDGDEVEVIGLDPARERQLTASSPDGRLIVETSIRSDSAEPMTVRMRPSADVTGRLIDQDGKAVAGASASVAYPSDDAPSMPLPRTFAVTDTEGRFRVEGLFPGHPLMIEFHRSLNAIGANEHYRPEALRKLILDDGRNRHVGTVNARSAAY